MDNGGALPDTSKSEVSYLMYIVHKAACVKLIDQSASRITAELVMMSLFFVVFNTFKRKLATVRL